MTLEGTFSQSTYAKTVGLRVGSVTRGTLGACTGGTASLKGETLPWSLLYSSFSGTLPAITGLTMRLLGATFSITPTGFPTCTARTTEAEPLPFISARNNSTGELTSIRSEEATAIRLTGLLCEGSRGRVIGTGSLTVAGETNPVMLLLGLTGTALAGAEPNEQEVSNPIKKLVIPAGSTEGTRAIKNISPYEVRLTRVVRAGENSEKFTLLESTEASCTGLPNLRPNEICNVKVAVNAGVTRPVETSVQITYTWAGGQTSSQSFNVRAE